MIKILFLFATAFFSSTLCFARASKVISPDGQYGQAETEADFQAPAPGALRFQGRFALYEDFRLGRAVCVPPVTSPESVLRRNGISTGGRVTPAEKAALAKGIGQVENLLGHPIPASWRTRYNFINAGGTWNQSTNGVNVRRGAPGSAKGLLTGRMMHELGHKVGNSGAYSRYHAATGGQICRISPYSTRGSKGTVRGNEEFAEVFEAYVVFPELLKAQCPKSFAYFSKSLFPGSSDNLAKCKGGGSGNKGSGSSNEQSAEENSSAAPRKNRSQSGAQ